MEHWNWKKDVLWGLGLTLGLIALYELYKYYAAEQAANASNAASAASQVAGNDAELNAQIAALGSNSGSSVDNLNALSGNTGPNISSASQISGLSEGSLQSLLNNLLSYSNPTPTNSNTNNTVQTYNPPLPSSQPATVTDTMLGPGGVPVSYQVPVLTPDHIQQALPAVSHN